MWSFWNYFESDIWTRGQRRLVGLETAAQPRSLDSVATDNFFYEAPKNTQEGPHIRDAVDVKRWMSIVIVALLPAILMAIWNTGLQKFVYASGDAVRMVQLAMADAERMEKLLPIYKDSEKVGEILREYFYERSIETVMRDTPGAFVLYKPRDGTNRELRVMMERRPPKRKAESEE